MVHLKSTEFHGRDLVRGKHSSVRIEDEGGHYTKRLRACRRDARVRPAFAAFMDFSVFFSFFPIFLRLGGLAFARSDPNRASQQASQRAGKKEDGLSEKKKKTRRNESALWGNWTSFSVQVHKFTKRALSNDELIVASCSMPPVDVNEKLRVRKRRQNDVIGYVVRHSQFLPLGDSYRFDSFSRTVSSNEFSTVRCDVVQIVSLCFISFQTYFFTDEDDEEFSSKTCKCSRIRRNLQLSGSRQNLAQNQTVAR